MKRLEQDKVLCYEEGRRSQSTIRRHYIKWRSEQKPPVPLRCDNPGCMFYNSQLVWNGIELKLILDHRNGVNGDNRPKNLQFLCPNCNSQQNTNGGRNRGRVIQNKGGFATVDGNHHKHYTLPAEVGKFAFISNNVELRKGK